MATSFEHIMTKDRLAVLARAVEATVAVAVVLVVVVIVVILVAAVIIVVVEILAQGIPLVIVILVARMTHYEQFTLRRVRSLNASQAVQH